MPTNFVSAPQPLTFKDPTANLFKSPVDNFIAKPQASAPKASSSKGASSVGKIYNPTIVPERTNVTTGIGFGEGQTVDTIQKGYSVGSYSTEPNERLKAQAIINDANEYQYSLINSSFTTKKANEMDKNLFNATKGLSFDSTLQDVKLAKVNASKQVSEFSNPSSPIASTFRKNIGEEAYNYYNDFVNGTESYIGALRSDKSLAEDSHPFTRSLYGTDLLRWVTNKATGGEMEKFNAAADYLAGNGEIETSLGDNLKKVGGTLVGDAPKYMAMGVAGDFAATTGLVEGGFAVGGNVGGQMVKLGNTINRISKSSPILYQATVNNGLVNALDFGVAKLQGKDYSSSDFINNLLVGAALPVVFKGVGESINKIGNIVKGVTAKDITQLEKSVTNHMQTQGSTTVKEAVDSIADTHIFQDGETLAKKIDDYIGATPKNPDGAISHTEVRSDFATQGKSISNIGSKKVAKTISKINEKLNTSEDIGNGYGELGINDRLQMVKKSIVDNLAGESVVNSEKAEAAITKAFKDNNVPHTSEFHISTTADDILDDAFHTKDFNPKALNEAKTLDEVESAIKGKKVVNPINEVRDKVDTSSTKIGDVEDIAKEYKINVNPDRLYKEGKLQNAYAHEILDKAELRRSGYNSATSIALTRAKETIKNSIASVAKSTGRLKTGVVNLGKEATKLKKEIVKGMANSPEYAITPSQRTSITNKYLSRSFTKLEDGTKIATKMSEELHLLSYKNLETKADGLVARVMKMNNSKSKKSNLKVESIQKIIETYSKFNEAKLTGDLTKMVEANQDLANFYKEGRDMFKAQTVAVKSGVKEDVGQLVEFMDSNKIDTLEMRMVNTPSSGIARPKTHFEKIRAFAESNIPANLQVSHIFKGNKVMEKIFLGNFQKTQTVFTNLRRSIVDIHAPKAISLAQKMGLSHDDASIKLSLWMGKDSEFAHENNLLTDITFMKNKNGKYEVVFDSDYKSFLSKNKDKVESGDVIHFGTSNNTPLKEKILNSIYSDFNSHYASNKEFKSTIDTIRSHLSDTGDRISDVSKRRFDKIFVKMENYFPMIKKGKGGVESAFDNSGEFSTFVKDTIEDGHMNTRVPPAQGQMVRRELGFAETLAFHMDSAVWWERNIENLLDADAVLRKMRQGRNGLLEDTSLIPKEDMYRLDKLAEEATQSDAIANPLMTDEVSFFLRTHIGKIATRGRNLSSGTDFGRSVVNGFNAQANRIMLSGPYTALKQTASLPDIAIQAGGDNFYSALRSASNKNISIALEDSGYLMERQATRLSKEGAGRDSYISSQKTFFQKAGALWNKGTDAITGNTTKLVDGAISSRAWLSGMSKYLDENDLYHTSGKKLDLAVVRDKIMSLENGSEIWSDAVQAADNMMSKVMGSNQLVDKAIGSESLLTKGTLLFQRTGLNHLVSTIDNVADKYRDSRFGGAGVTKATALASLQAAKVALGSAFVYADFKAIQYLKNQVSIGLGSKDSTDTEKIYDSFGNEITNPSYEDIVWNEMKFWFASNMISPNMGIDLTTGFSPAINQFKKVAKAPTNERMMEELFHTVAKASMNGSWEDMLRYGMSTIGVGMTSSVAKKYDTAATTVLDQYHKNNASTPNNIDELIKTQMDVNAVNGKVNEGDKKVKASRDTFINDFIAQSKGNPSEEEFVKFAKANMGRFKDLGLKKDSDVDTLLTQAQTRVSKTSGERDSILMGKSTDVIFELQIKPLLDKGDKNAAWEEIKRLTKKGVIKSDSGIEKLIILSKNYTNGNKAQ